MKGADTNTMGDEPHPQDRLPVSVLTGFLGAGKTTLLRHLIAQPGFSDTAVVINEFGEIGLDHLLVESASEDLVLMASGCICCSIRNDVILALRQLYKRRQRRELPPFRRLVIETTGLADPAPVLHALMTDPLLSAFYRLDGIVTVVDGLYGDAQLDRQIEAVKQAALADRLILSKIDLTGAEKVKELRARLRRLNPGATLIEAIDGRVDPEAIFGAGLFDPARKSPDARRWLNEEAYADIKREKDQHHHGEHHHGHAPADDAISALSRHDQGIQSFCLTADEPLDWARFCGWAERLIAQEGGNIYRIKGILNVQGEARPIAVHGIQHVLHPPAYLPYWQDHDRRSRIVFIGKGLDRRGLSASFRECGPSRP